MLRELDERAGPPGDEAVARRRLLGTVQELWGSDELRAVSPTVLDEVRSGLVYFTSTLAAVVPEIYRDLEAAIAERYPGDDDRVPPLLTLRLVDRRRPRRQPVRHAGRDRWRRSS